MSDKQFTNVRAAETEVEKKSGKDSCHLGVWHWALIVIVILVCAGLGIGLGVYFGVFADQSVHVSPVQESSDPPLDPTDPNDIRLPTYLIPDTYIVRLRPVLTGSDPSQFHFFGTVRILFNVTQSTDVITIHTKNLTVNEESVLVNSPTDGPVEVKGYSVDPAREFLNVQLNGSLSRQDLVSIYLEFSGPIKPDLAGIYYSSYDMDGETKYLLTSHLHPTEARKVFPSFDEPQLKSKFNVTLEKVNDTKIHTLSNMVIYSQETL